MPPPIYMPGAHGCIPELPGDREPGELAADYPQEMDSDDLRIDPQLHRISMDSTDLQIHRRFTSIDEDPMNATDTAHIPSRYSRALTPIDTSIDMTAVLPSTTNCGHGSPSNGYSRYYGMSVDSDAMIFSPQSSISPSSFQISRQTSESPARIVTHHTGPIGAGGHDVRASDAFVDGQTCTFRPHDGNFVMAGQHSFNYSSPFVSPLASASNSNVQEYHMPQTEIISTLTSSPLHRTQSSISIDHQLHVFTARQSTDLQHIGIDLGQIRPAQHAVTSEALFYDPSRRSTGDIYPNHPIYPSPGPPSSHYTNHQVPSHPSLHTDETLPTYEECHKPPHFPHREAQETPPAPRRRRIKKTAAAATVTRALMSIIHPLKCSHCDELFHGAYQKGNRARHIRCKHPAPNSAATAHVDDGRSCQQCDQRFGRSDARRKHEWKQHGRENCRPKKRQNGGRRSEKVIYMP